MPESRRGPCVPAEVDVREVSSRGGGGPRVRKVTASSTLPILPTSLVGSYAQPDWLIDRAQAGRPVPAAGARQGAVAARPGVPRAGAGRRHACWRSAPRRRPGWTSSPTARCAGSSYSNHFATALEGVDIDNPGTALDRSGHPNPVPRVAGPIVPAATRSSVATWSSCGRTPTAPIKMTVPGPFTMSQQAQNDYYPDAEAAGAGLRRGRERRDQGPVRRRRRHRADRRALHAGPARGGPRVRPRGAQRARSTASPARPPCTSASGTRRSSTSAPRATRSFPSWPAARPTRSRSRPRSRVSTSACSRDLADKTIILGVIDLSDHEVESAETGRRPGPPSLRLRRAERSPSPPTAG